MARKSYPWQGAFDFNAPIQKAKSTPPETQVSSPTPTPQVATLSPIVAEKVATALTSPNNPNTGTEKLAPIQSQPTKVPEVPRDLRAFLVERLRWMTRQTGDKQEKRPNYFGAPRDLLNYIEQKKPSLEAILNSPLLVRFLTFAIRDEVAKPLIEAGFNFQRKNPAGDSILLATVQRWKSLYPEYLRATIEDLRVLLPYIQKYSPECFHDLNRYSIGWIWRVEGFSEVLLPFRPEKRSEEV